MRFPALKNQGEERPDFVIKGVSRLKRSTLFCAQYCMKDFSVGVSIVYGLSYREISYASGITTIFPRDKYRLGSPREEE
jgi:hypothetical protein